MKDKVFFEHNGLKIINDDVLTTSEVEKNSIDLIVTSPPYNVSKVLIAVTIKGITRNI